MQLSDRVHALNMPGTEIDPQCCRNETTTKENLDGNVGEMVLISENRFEDIKRFHFKKGGQE